MKDHLASILIPLLSISALMVFEAAQDKDKDAHPDAPRAAASESAGAIDGHE